MTRVFTDASSAILLSKAGLFDPFSDRYDIILSRRVYAEITAPGYRDAQGFRQAKKDRKLKVLGAPDPCTAFDKMPGVTGLHQGEKETICLFLAQKKGFILTDDGTAARWCHKNRLPFINALLVPKLFWYDGCMSEKECMDHMNALCRLGRYGDKIKTIAFESSRDDLRLFLVKGSV